MNILHMHGCVFVEQDTQMLVNMIIWLNPLEFHHLFGIYNVHGVCKWSGANLRTRDSRLTFRLRATAFTPNVFVCLCC